MSLRVRGMSETSDKEKHTERIPESWNMGLGLMSGGIAYILHLSRTMRFFMYQLSGLYYDVTNTLVEAPTIYYGR